MRIQKAGTCMNPGMRANRPLSGCWSARCSGDQDVPRLLAQRLFNAEKGRGTSKLADESVMVTRRFLICLRAKFTLPRLPVRPCISAYFCCAQEAPKNWQLSACIAPN